MTHLQRRGAVAGAHAGRALDPDRLGIDAGLELGDQPLGTHEAAGQAVADPDGHRRWCGLVLGHDVEMGVEGGDLVDLGLGEPHRLGQRLQVCCTQMAEMVLQHVQVLDQQVAAAWPVAEQRRHLGSGSRVQLPALGRSSPATLAASGDGNVDRHRPPS